MNASSTLDETILEIEKVHLLRCKATDMAKCDSRHQQLINRLTKVFNENKNITEMTLRVQFLEKQLRESQRLVDFYKENEASVERRVRHDISAAMQEARDHWIVQAETKPGSLAEFINSVFNIAIKFLEPEKEDANV